MAGVETESDIWLASGSVLMRVSSTGNWACVDEEGGSGMAREGTTAERLGSCEKARAGVIDTSSSWILGGIKFGFEVEEF